MGARFDVDYGIHDWGCRGLGKNRINIMGSGEIIFFSKRSLPKTTSMPSNVGLSDPRLRRQASMNATGFAQVVRIATGSFMKLS